MTLTLNAGTKILSLAKQYDFLFDVLVGINPKLRRLKNPILQKTIGAKATIADVAKIAGKPVDELLNLLKDEISGKAGDEVQISTEKTPETKWEEELSRREEAMKQLILDLHEGKDIKELQARFNEIIKDVSAEEIAEMEQSLISSGQLTAEQVTAMCDLHVQVFKESLDVHEKPETTPGHPVHTYMLENAKAREIMDAIRNAGTDQEKMEGIKNLANIITHYTRLENQLFPILEKAGITGPSTVMWAKHDEIREMFKNPTPGDVDKILAAVEDMIYKETTILFPMAMETLSEYDWVQVKIGEDEIGYAWIKPKDEWRPITPLDIHQVAEEKEVQDPEISLNTGTLSLADVDLILRKLPLDISFVGPDDKVKYYSATDDRIFPRSPGVIGRKVINCHPRKSYDKVQKILTAFKEGTKDEARFWIQLGGRFIVITYYAIRDAEGNFKGTLEVSQDITELRALEGEKRLLDWD